MKKPSEKHELKNADQAVLKEIFTEVCSKGFVDEHGNPLGRAIIRAEFAPKVDRIVNCLNPERFRGMLGSDKTPERIKEFEQNVETYDQAIRSMKRITRELFGSAVELTSTLEFQKLLAITPRDIRAGGFKALYLDERDSVVFSFLMIGTIVDLDTPTTTRRLKFTEAAQLLCDFYWKLEEHFDDYTSPYPKYKNTETVYAEEWDHTGSITKKVKRYFLEKPLAKEEFGSIDFYSGVADVDDPFTWYWKAREENIARDPLNWTLTLNKEN